MGFKILPICTNCGYKTKSIAIGGGRLTHLTNCGAPALNTESNEIEQINLYDYEKTVIIKKKFLYFFSKSIAIVTKNKKYIPYYEPSMFTDDLEIENHNWGNKCYKKSKNFCPKCKTFNLDFLGDGVYFD
ncbi:hypothetical protein [Flavobacterium limnophilum]|uniref:hypothetical protein n=1 Tax=Flavobacterium limnophilum TaxID=3003262 RepID=UPI0022AC396A|nr:hypothetical protein [Flavobacterium limnophilum]